MAPFYIKGFFFCTPPQPMRNKKGRIQKNPAGVILFVGGDLISHPFGLVFYIFWWDYDCWDIGVVFPVYIIVF
jgi:hypothetical protein